METLCSSKFEFFLTEKILANKTFKGLKLENSDFFIATHYDDTKKNYFKYILSKRHFVRHEWTPEMNNSRILVSPRFLN